MATVRAAIQLYPDLVLYDDRVPKEVLIAFLGGTIGNFRPGPRRAFLARIATLMYPEDRFLLGTDLVKESARLEAAYNDRAGVTAEFNRNVLHVLNRELDADFDVDAFAHVALWDPEEEWIEMRLRASRPMRVRVADLDLHVHFDQGEQLHTEVSAKFRREGIAAELAAAIGIPEEHALLVSSTTGQATRSPRFSETPTASQPSAPSSLSRSGATPSEPFFTRAASSSGTTMYSHRCIGSASTIRRSLSIPVPPPRSGMR